METSDGCSTSIATSDCTGKVNSSGCTPSIVAGFQGTDLYIDAEQVLPGQVGLLGYIVQGSASIPFQGGFLCVLPPVTRTPVQISGATGSPPCTGTYAFDFTAYVASGVDPTLVGRQPVWAQYRMRDSGVPTGTGLTNGLTFTLCP